MIKISGKVDKPTLTMDSAILIFHSSLKKELEKVLLSMKNEISKLLNPLSVLVYPLFHLFRSNIYVCIYIYIYIYI